jgi:hypothetical protein
VIAKSANGQTAVFGLGRSSLRNRRKEPVVSVG